MGGTYRHQALINAPVEDVWAVVSDPSTQPEWWPDVLDVQIDEPLVEGGEYRRTSKPVPFLDAMESVWVAERLEDLKEARFRCTVSGSWARFTLTPARGKTYVELESGMDPTTDPLAAGERDGRPLPQGLDREGAGRVAEGGGCTTACTP